MKSEVRMTDQTRRQYTEAFKREAVRLVQESTRSVAQVARDVGIPENLWYRWRSQYRQAEAQGTTRAAQRTEAEELVRMKRELARVHPGTGLFNTCGGVLHEGVAMRSRIIQAYAGRDPLRLMCRTMAVSPAGYYAWCARPESARAAANRALLTDIRQLHRESHQTYGSSRIWHALREQGHRVGEHRVARSCGTMGCAPRPP